jgi:hypothetical protein
MKPLLSYCQSHLHMVHPVFTNSVLTISGQYGHYKLYGKHGWGGSDVRVGQAVTRKDD